MTPGAEALIDTMAEHCPYPDDTRERSAWLRAAVRGMLGKGEPSPWDVAAYKLGWVWGWEWKKSQPLE